MRCFSRLPKARNWETHLDLEEIMGLSGVSGELGSLFRTRFRMLCVSKTKYCYDENLYYGWKLRTEPHLWRNDIEVARKYVLTGGRESLRTLVVGIDMYRWYGRSSEVINDFQRSCPNLTSLSVGEARNLWVDIFKRQLLTLEVATERRALHPHQTSMLRELTLYSGEYYFKLESCRPVIENLETLVITGGFSPEKELRDIRRYCPNLKRISTAGRSEVQSIQVMYFLASYGDQLQYASLRDLKEWLIRKVVSACPNARFHLHDFSYGVSVACLNMLAERLEEATVSGFYIQDDPYPGWIDAWDKCINLRKLSMSNCTLKQVEAMFATPKDHLNILSLDIQMTMDEKTMEELMNVCANGTKCVEKLVYRGQPFYRDTAHQFFQQNRYSLASITVGKKYDDGDAKVGDLLESVIQLPALGQLNLDCKFPERTLRALEGRGVHFERGIFAWQ